MKLGNNRWGSKGCVKCDECRRRKTKVSSTDDNANSSVYTTSMSHMRLATIVRNGTRRAAKLSPYSPEGCRGPIIPRRLLPPIHRLSTLECLPQGASIPPVPQ
jgi:hypothetical protein